LRHPDQPGLDHTAWPSRTICGMDS
jgi:hypothetical protein